MPELPEVETIRRALAGVLCGRCVKGVETTVPALREPLSATELAHFAAGKILSVRRRAKFLIFDFPGDRSMLAHLGMTGSFRVMQQGGERQKHDRAFFRLDKNEVLVYNDIRRFGVLKGFVREDCAGLPPELAGFGPEPLEKDFCGNYLHRRLQRCKGPVKPFIMDQRVVVGVGNIYASEALFRAGISPERTGASLTAHECATLVNCIRKVLNESLKLGGTTISDYKRPDGSEGNFALRLKVYGRAGLGCARRGCGGLVRRIVQGGRATFYCPTCQK